MLRHIKFVTFRGTNRMNRLRVHSRASVVAMVAGLVLTVSAAKVEAATQCVGFSAFQNLSTQQLTSLQVRLAPVASTEKTPPALAFTYLSNPIDTTKFAACEAGGVNYDTDNTPPFSFLASTDQLNAMINNVSALSQVTAGGVSPNPFFSFEMFVPSPNPIGFEVVLDKPSSQPVFDALRASFQSNASALIAIDRMACGPGFLESGTPTNVTSSVAVKLQGMRLKRSTGTYVGFAQVTNNSTGALATPLSIVMDFSNNVVLANPSGFTCNTIPVGRGFINVATPPGAGQSTNVPIEILNPGNLAITLNQVIVLAGSGAR